MRNGGARRLLTLAAVVAAAGATGGCDLADEGTDLVNGKQQFVENCGRCHELARAGTSSPIGPSLDAAFQRAREDGFGESTFEGLVKAQIASPNSRPSRDPETGEELPVMPADIVTGNDAEDVAAYVAYAAGRPGEDSGRLAQAGGGPEGTAEAEGGVLTIPADPGGGTFFEFADAASPPGALDVRSPNESSVDHNIAIEGGGVDEIGPVVRDGGVSEIQVDLQAGEYTFYCSVPGHREGGMEGTLTVE
jgi:plastocyanin/mono/diheme cytochrome c family protein